MVFYSYKNLYTDMEGFSRASHKCYKMLLLVKGPSTMIMESIKMPVFS